ncbi:hypothetical protein, partial [Treponema sp.]|uniref:hypothetical protein n=1 Tax=Treponema sp. TaxID=166 RepID=UPI0038901308
MKKVFILLSLTASLGIASVFLFTRNDIRFSLFLQKFIKSPEEKVPLTLISIDKDFVQKFSSPFASNSIIEDAVIASRELGSTGHIKDFGYNKSFSKIFPQTLKTQINAQRETSLFGLKIVLPNQNNLNEDSKTPENYNPLTPQQKVHLIYKKGRQYYADSVFASLLENFDNSNLQIDNFSIKFADKSIPRIYDGSVLLKYPQTSYKNWNTVSVLELYNYKKSEEVFYSYLKLMSKRGLFGELNSENPLDIYETAESLKNKPGLKDYIYLKEKFYKLINSYLSGKQEKILIEETGDEEYREIICNSFKTCKTLFNNLEAERKNLISKINGSFCVFAVTADTLSDFISSPVDSKLPESLTAYVLAHMIYNDDFVDFLSPLLSFSLAVLLCLILAILSLKIKKAFPVIILAAVFVIIFPAAVIFTYIKFKIYTGFFIITPSLLTYLLLTAIYALIKNKQEWLSLSSKI